MGVIMRKSKYLEQEKEVGHIIESLEKCGLEIKVIEVPTANHGPDIQFRIFHKGKYLTDACDIWDLEYLAIVLEGMK